MANIGSADFPGGWEPDSGIKSLPLHHGITQSITHYPAGGISG